ncbi:MAG: AAA family ATPase [Planctomycetaceae bacterium]
MDHSSPLIQSLLSPKIWPDNPDRVELIETHISWVLITRDFAWKLRKPVSFGFIDFSTPELRLHYADEEFRLNRRTSPKLYLDVVPITGTFDQPVIGGDGPVIEYAVKMRRFEQDQLLLRIANTGPLDLRVVMQLAETLADFHQHVEIAEAASSFGSFDAVRQDALDNFSTLKALLPPDAPELSTLARLEAWTHAELKRLEPEIQQRHRSGKVRECHGDLHLANIVMINDRPMLFDCLEFNEQLRWIDVMNEIAFLVMDLEEHRQQVASRVLLNRYLEVTGDYEGLRILRFYIVYRALVRAKVDLLRCQQSHDSKTVCRMRRESAEYLRLAAADSSPSQPMLIIMHGISGSGKSFVSAKLIEATHAIRIRSDIERKRLSGIDESEHRHGNAAEQLYSQNQSVLTYQRLLQLSETILFAGDSVVVDATFLSKDRRNSFRELASRRSVPFLIVACEAPLEVLRQRVAARNALGNDVSDADPAVLENQLAIDSQIDQEPGDEVLRIDTSADADIQRGIGRLQQMMNPQTRTS